ncbi:T9SS type A sorting domain-containing protein [Seonamhaeicola marinus]|uniref:T9SS type A sorting domain-containing protein n=1 Tax=Seonamhaeicola marinus TaxID=1912246 RepID=A0A5D0J931_9FLAO|nr:T9SS type A sorting domain-containing protein [Seonamhaeicola marinus]TYA92244.1 T9SS type A sorting domain-containing protein [Seonamhaeicola marinus]
MKKITLTLFLCLISLWSFAQTFSTGTVTLSTTSGLEYSAQIDITSTQVTLTLVGPSDRWLGLGFGVDSMTSGGDVVIFDGTNLTDRTFQGIGSLPILDSNQDWSISSNNTTSGVRTLVATRSLNTGETNDYVFSTSDASVDLVWARGGSSSFTISNHGGGNRGIQGNNGITLGVNDLASNNFKIFPNPTSTNLNIESSNSFLSAEVKIYNALGKEVLNQNISKLDESIDVSSLSNGIYLIKLVAFEKVETKRFVKL